MVLKLIFFGFIIGDDKNFYRKLLSVCWKNNESGTGKNVSEITGTLFCVGIKACEAQSVVGVVKEPLSADTWNAVQTQLLHTVVGDADSREW